MAYGFGPYVSVADRLLLGAREVKRKLAKGEEPAPVLRIEGRKIAHTFWGAAWCDHLEKHSDYETRLPRGRTYAKNGSVVHLALTEGKVVAYVRGTELYTIEVTIAKLAPKRWKEIVAACAGQIDSLVELLQGKLSKGVMQIVTDRETGMFPAPGEITLKCSCPDWADMCKHVAAALYGVGARLDQKPELLFLLRGVDHLELLGSGTRAPAGKAKSAGKRALASADLGDLFGIELASDAPEPAKKKRAKDAAPPASKTPPRKKAL